MAKQQDSRPGMEVLREAMEKGPEAVAKIIFQQCPPNARICLSETIYSKTCRVCWQTWLEKGEVTDG